MSEPAGLPSISRPLDIDVALVGTTCELQLRGELDADSACALAAAVRAAGLAELIVVDVSELAFIDSSGISSLITARRKLAERGGVLVVRSPSPRVRRVLELTGVLDLLTPGGTPPTPEPGTDQHP